MVMALELRLHSPAGTEPNIYKWPLTSGRGAVSRCYCVPLLLLVTFFDLLTQHFNSIALSLSCDYLQPVFLLTNVFVCISPFTGQN